MRTTFFRGGFIATLMAGPLYLLMIAVATCLLDPGTPIELPQADAELALLLPLLLAALVFGSMLAILPIWIGGTVMSWVSARNPGLMHPAFWMIAGGSMAATASAPLDPSFETPHSLALIATGIFCALIVRYGTRWPDGSA